MVLKQNYTYMISSGYSTGVLTNIYCSEPNVDAVNTFVDGNVDGNVDETLFQLFPDKFQ